MAAADVKHNVGEVGCISTSLYPRLRLSSVHRMDSCRSPQRFSQQSQHKSEAITIEDIIACLADRDEAVKLVMGE